MIMDIRFHHSLQRRRPGEPGDQGPTGAALHGQCPMHDEGRKNHCVALAESNPVAGPLAIEHLDAPAVVPAAGELDDHRYFAQAHLTWAEIHMPIVELVLGVT